MRARRPRHTVHAMKFSCFWPLFGVTLVVMFLVAFLHGSVTAGARERCNVVEACTKTRQLVLDNSWLCCEDDSGWVAAHILHPTALALFTGSPSLTIIAYFYFEAIEADFITLFKTFVFVPADPEQLETLSGALIGDAQINGTLGLLLAIAIAQLVGWHGFGHYWMSGAMQTKVAAKYALLYVVFAAAYIFNGLSSDSVAYGSIIATVVQLVHVLLIVPLFVKPNDVDDVDLTQPYRRLKWLWALAILCVMPSGYGWRYFANNWYQAWLPTVVLILVFKALAIWSAVSGGGLRRSRRRDELVAKVNE